MFENLTSQQKIMFVLLGIVALICLVLVLYFALSKKSCPDANKCAPPSLVKFAISKADPPSSIPWTTPTYYRYSYYITDSSTEGEKSDISLPVVAPTGKETNPVIQVTLPLSIYKINVYRALDDGQSKGVPGTFSLLNVTVDNTTGLFTDTNNPSPTKPPKPLVAPVNTGWGGGGGGGLMCPTSSIKCTEPCTSPGQCDPTQNPWQCTSGDGVSGACSSKNDWESNSNCTTYCYIKS